MEPREFQELEFPIRNWEFFNRLKKYSNLIEGNNLIRFLALEFFHID